MMTETLWMTAMLVMFGLFLRGLSLEARRSLQVIAHDEDDREWRADMQVALAQQSARERLRAMREEQMRQETAKRVKAEREAFRAAQLRRTRWEYAAPRSEFDELDLSGEAFGDHGFARIADILDEDELYGNFRPFAERINRFSADKGAEHSFSNFDNNSLTDTEEEFQHHTARPLVAR